MTREIRQLARIWTADQNAEDRFVLDEDMAVDQCVAMKGLAFEIYEVDCEIEQTAQGEKIVKLRNVPAPDSPERVMHYVGVDKIYTVKDIVTELDQVLANPQIVAGDADGLPRLKTMRDAFNDMAPVLAQKQMPALIFIREPALQRYDNSCRQFSYTALGEKQNAYDKAGVKIWPLKP